MGGTRSTSSMILAAVAAATTLVVVFATTGEPSESREPAAGYGYWEPPAPGWRWESYGGVDLQVPDEWGHGTTGAPPCLSEEDIPGPGYVGRPGAVPSIGCPEPVAPLDRRTPYLWFDSRAEPAVHEYDARWVAETRVVEGLALTVLTDDDVLRARILDSARPSAEGPGRVCPTEHPVLTDPDFRPDPGPGGLAALGPAESITVCRYAYGTRTRPTTSPVLSIGRLTGQTARAAIAAMLAAPAGTGPNKPTDCMPEYARGDEVLLLTAWDGTRAQEVVVRYAGCDAHGLDDGHTHRRLTGEPLRLLLTGPHKPTVLHDDVAALAWP